jgi:hypothetical protein
MLPRRQVLAASSRTLPLFAALGSLGMPAVLTGLTGCAGDPGPLDGPPPTADVRTLIAAVAAEDNLVHLYAKTISAYSVLGHELAPLMADHRAHRRQLAARIIEPSGKTLRVRPPARPQVPDTESAALALLRAAERAAITAQLKRLPAASPAQAQLYASIAASEATHISALNGQFL